MARGVPTGRGSVAGRGGGVVGRGRGESSNVKSTYDPAGKALNWQIIQASNNGMEAILHLLETDSKSFNLINCCTALNRLTRLAGSPAERAALQESVGFQSLLRDVTRVLPSCDARATSIAAHACASLGVGDKPTLSALGDAIRANVEQLDRQGIANVLWALAKLPRNLRGDAPIDTLTRVACDCAEDFTSQELANIVWALPQLNAHDQRLIQKLALIARHNIASFIPQGLAMLALGFSSLGIFSEPLFTAIGGAAAQLAHKCNPQDAAQILTAFAKFKIKNDELFQALCDQASKADWGEQGGESVTSFLWALGTLRQSSEMRILLRSLLQRTSELAASLKTRHVVLALTGLAKILPLVEASRVGKMFRRAVADIVARIADVICDLDPQDVGLVAWAISVLSVEGRLALLHSLFKHASTMTDSLSWWSIAHLEYAFRALNDIESQNCLHGGSNIVDKRAFFDLLDVRTGLEDKRLVEESDSFHSIPETAIIKESPWTNLGIRDGRVLIVGKADSLRQTLRDAGFGTVTWLRFADGKKRARSWPSKPAERPYVFCCLRYPGSTDAFEFFLDAAAFVLDEGVPLFIFGHVREGVLGALSSISPLFSEKDRKLAKGKGLARIIAAMRTKAEPKGSLDNWIRETSVDLGQGLREWAVLPGLFAGGGLDVMTTLLLERLSSTLPSNAFVLDFGCGSGALAAGLSAQRNANVVLLDADAAALEVARRNLPDMQTILGNGLTAFQDEEYQSTAFVFDAIVSNPPVHRGQPDDWTVLRNLINDAAHFLKPKGKLWLVAQEHVPVGRLFSIANGTKWSVKLDFSDGRFAVWCASPKNKAFESETASVKRLCGSREEESIGSKRRRK